MIIPAAAQESEMQLDWGLCTTISKPSIFADIPPPSETDGIDLSADSMRSIDNGQLQILEGNVMIIRQQDRTRADNGVYDQSKNLIKLSGNVVLETNNLNIKTDGMEMIAGNAFSQIENVDFSLMNEHAHGHADLIQRLGESRTILNNTSYTTCNPDTIDWQFRAKELRMEHDLGMGVAKGMTLRFKDIPIFYFPSISFPIDNRRKSGFLLPNIGSSSDSGSELSLPYYWNLAPQADATLTPRYMSKRGLQLNSEWRYMSPNSLNQLDYAFLNDQLADSTTTEAERQFYHLTHTGRLGSNWNTAMDISGVSDGQYFNDLGNSLSIVSITHLTRQLSLGSGGQHWSFQARALNFQTIDPAIPETSKPYSYLPQLTFNTYFPDFLGNMSYTMLTEFSAFDHDINTTGQRFDINPRLSWTAGSAGWYLTPTLSAHHTEYRLDANTTVAAEAITRTVPTGSLDAGIFLERNIGKNDHLLQTLEPRLFYLYTPFRDQSAIPLFDTLPLDFSFAQLFRENTFSGIDRIADAQQATIALTSRILEKSTGIELFRGSLGQISYFEDRKTTLSSSIATQIQKKSDLAGEIQARLSQNWNLSTAIEWNPETRDTSQSAARLQYKSDNQHILNIGYRFRDETLEQSDISAAWPISDRWAAVARWNRSLNDDVDLEKFFGLEYKSCCYSFRIAARRYLNIANQDSKFDNTIFLQLSFTGFTSIGSNIGELLEQGILGYRENQ